MTGLVKKKEQNKQTSTLAKYKQIFSPNLLLFVSKIHIGCPNTIEY